MLSWSYPETPRGNITGYMIFHNVTGDGEVNITLPFMNDMSDQTHIFVGLKPFTYYEFIVAAFAVDEIIHFGNPSEPEVERTDEDCKILRTCFCLEWLS